MAEEKKIKKDMLIGEVVQSHPEAVSIMLEYGLHCVGCHVSAFETVEQGAKAHGLDDKKINEMLEKMNSLAEKEKEE